MCQATSRATAEYVWNVLFVVRGNVEPCRTFSFLL